MHLTIAPRQPSDRGRTNPHCAAGWHGTASAYRGGCRCPEAVEHKRIYDKRIKQGRHQTTVVDATGTRRRLQALAALGWSWHNLAPMFGCTRGAVSLWVRGRHVHAETRERVRAVYETLAGTAGPSAESRRRAVQRGWAPPQAWDDTIDDPDATPNMGAPVDDQPDPVVVARALAGQVTWGKLTGPDRAAYIREAKRRGLATTTTCGLVGVGQHHLQQWIDKHLDGKAA